MTETDAPSHGPIRSPFHHGGQSQARQDLLEETNGELAILFSTLYFFVEIFRGDTDFAEELSELAKCSAIIANYSNDASISDP